jgi:hypothetical protein
VRKSLLTVHVTVSVGWLGAVAGFLALAVSGLVSDRPETVRAAAVAGEVLGWWVLVPLSLASLVTGVVQGLGTTWGLFRHWWVVFKLAINLVATGLLLLHMQPIQQLAHVAAHGAVGSELSGLRVQVTVQAALALLVLVAATVLSVVKPAGRTPYAQRRLPRGPGAPQEA